MTNIEEEIKAFYVKYGADSQRYIFNRLLKTSIVKRNRIFFREDIFYKEDGLFLIEYLCKSNGKVAHNSQSLYKYLQNPNSAMHVIKKSYNPRLFTNVTAHRLIISQIKKNCSKDSVKLAKKNAKGSYLWVIITMGGYRACKFNDLLFAEFDIMKAIGFVDYLLWSYRRFAWHIKHIF